jgi:catechol 2,3-dioxygenase-like lactoylglutathione lyase family enzyme
MSIMENGSRANPVFLRGLRHLALRVTDLARSRNFYEGLLGMKVVWEPDSQNIYLTSGSDNLALHEIRSEEQAAFRSGNDQPLDHLGFLVESPSDVESMANRMAEAGVQILKPPRQHRDGSYSFYMTDPDGNVIQILYEPHISPL